MKKFITLCLASMLALAPAVTLAGCGGWEKLTNGGIAIESAERDDKGYIVEEVAKEGAFRTAEITEAECDLVYTQLDESQSPARWIVDFDANGTSYHYVVNAENGELIDFTSLSL